MDLPHKQALTEADKAIYEWQIALPGLGETGQLKLRNATALVSRVGGLGGPLAFQLAAAGIGKLILAHGGNLKPSDLNRQILMRHDCLGTPRASCAQATLAAFNPDIEVEAVDANIRADNAAELVGRSDIVFDCAPLFEERFLMNQECVRQGKPLIDCAMYGLEGQVIPILPGETPCLACIYPETPVHWKRRFPVIGAVSSLVATVGALEGMKQIAGFGPVSTGFMIWIDTPTMAVRKIAVKRRADCGVCGGVSLSTGTHENDYA